MDRDFIEEYLSAITRFKKVGTKFPSNCEIQWSELIIMQKICGQHCSSESGINVSEIHENLFITKPAVSQTLNNLEKKGYIVREININDRRKVSVGPTSLGEETLKRSLSNYDYNMELLYQKFGKEDMTTLISLLNKLADILDEFE